MAISNFVNVITSAAARFFGRTERVLEVGQKLPDGTVVFHVDPENNKALVLPGNIFGGMSTFKDQDAVVTSANDSGLHGHSDWRRMTDAEGRILSLLTVWNDVAPKDLRMAAPPTPLTISRCFWLASKNSMDSGKVGAPGVTYAIAHSLDTINFVPIVRTCPARVPTT